MLGRPDLVARLRNVTERARKNGRAEELQRELENLFEAQNTTPSRETTKIPATFMCVTVSV